MRVVSFNVKFAKDIDGALKALEHPDLAKADILLLQEMDLTGTERISCELGRNFDHILFAGLEPAAADGARRGLREGSDHFPIRADFRFPGPTGPGLEVPQEATLPPLSCGVPIP